MKLIIKYQKIILSIKEKDFKIPSEKDSFQRNLIP